MATNRDRGLALRWLAALALAVILVGFLVVWRQRSPGPNPMPEPVFLSDEELTNTRFTAPPADPYQLPRLVPVPLPYFAGASVIWGGTGRDSRGHIWAGVCASGVPAPSAHLVEYRPETEELIDRGDVLTRLKEFRLDRPGEGQMKIHTRIVQAQDSHLYFASSDEQGENEDGSRLPTWGSHLWRYRIADDRWEHLLAVPEGLIAVAGVGRYVYALGYFDHILYQYDCVTGKTASVRVGSVGGHVSRNFLCDHHGHAHVPRLRSTPSQPPRLVVTLVEFDTALRQVGESPLSHYANGPPGESHGITGFHYLADRSIAFVTHPGYLYRLISASLGSALVVPEGWLHPAGPSYTASLMSYDGARYLMGASRRQPSVNHDYEWVVYDLQTHTSRAQPLPLPIRGEAPLLYGSLTRDNLGNFYLAGTDGGQPTSRPLLLQVRPGRP